jgi:hypothetical protein
MYMQVLRLLAPCQGYEKGKTINEIAEAIYGRSDFQAKAMSRQLIGAARKAMKRQGISVDICSIKLVGMRERRYCHLTTVTEYTKAINDFERHIEGIKETKEGLESRRKTVEEREKLKEVKKVKADSKQN